MIELTREVIFFRGKQIGRSSKEVTYYVSSLHFEAGNSEVAQQVMAAIREYWRIEGGLHQRLDVSGAEDASKVKNRNALRILGTLRRSIHGVYMAWREPQKKKRNIGLKFFFEAMSKNNQLEAYRKIS